MDEREKKALEELKRCAVALGSFGGERLFNPIVALEWQRAQRECLEAAHAYAGAVAVSAAKRGKRP